MIAEGVELDRVVVLSICRKANVEIRYGTLFICWNDHDKSIGCEYSAFRPSHDLNHAFAAAERASLFDTHALSQAGGLWRVTPAQEGLWFGDPVIATGRTPALAICKAILHLKGLTA